MKNPKTLTEEFCKIGKHTGLIISFESKNRNNYLLKSYLIPRGKFVFAFQSGTPWKKRFQIDINREKKKLQ